MKKLLLLTKTLLAVALLCVGQNAWGAVPFVVKQNGSISDGVITASFSGKNKYCLAIADLSEETGISTAAKVVVEFDTKMSKGARWEIGIGDKSVRGENATGECSGSTYQTNGLIMYFGNKDNNYYLVNGSTYSKDAAFNTTVHATITLDRLAGTYSYTLVDTEGEGGTLFSGSAISTTVSNATIVEAYSWNNASTLTVSDVTVTVTQPFTYTVNAIIKNTSTVLRTLKTETVIEGESVTVPYPQYINVNGTLYNAPCLSDKDGKGNPQGFGYIFEATGEPTKTIEYSATATTNVLYYSEAEDIAGMTACSDGQGNSRGSGKKGAYASSDVTIGYLPAGKYRLTAQVVGNSGATFKFYAGEDEILSKGTMSYRDVATSDEFVLSETKKIILKAAGRSGSSAQLLDLIYVTGTPDNETIGNFDCSTASADNVFGSDIILKKGEIKKITFKNHGSDYGKNWMLKYSYGGAEVTTIRADWYWKYEGDDPAMVAKRVGTYTDAYTHRETGDVWAHWPSDMANSTVELTVSNVGGIFSVNGTMAGAADEYYFKYAYDNSFDGDITLNLSVNLSWLELLSVEQTAVAATITSAGYATFSSTKDLDFSDVEGLTAYIATDDDASTVTIEPVDDAKAGTGLVLKGEAKTYSIPVIASGTDHSATNKLWAITEDGNVKKATDDDYTNYVLAMQSGNVVFASVTGENSAPVKAGQAALCLYTGSSTPARALRLSFGDITSVANVEAAAEAKAQDGKFIEKGKLVIVKNGVKYNAAGQQVK